MVEIHFEEIEEIPGVSPEFLLAWFTDVTMLEGKKLGDLNVVFCSDDYLLNMNRDHLDHDYYTDIITFDFSEDDVVSGDLFVSADRVAENAKDLSLTFVEELNRVCVHGVLHLCGYQDKTDEESRIMRAKEDQMLELRKFHVKHLES